MSEVGLLLPNTDHLQQDTDHLQQDTDSFQQGEDYVRGWTTSTKY
jgi:hypothetical protein